MNKYKLNNLKTLKLAKKHKLNYIAKNIKLNVNKGTTDILQYTNTQKRL